MHLESLRTSRGILCGVVLLALLHCALWFADYGQTALGESPALDNRQTLELARAMAQGQLPAEPFHRAPLYPYLLSLFLSAGVPDALLPWVARWLNALALAAIAAAVAAAALRLWKKPLCAWLAGLLVALNPVLVFFAGDAFDILLAAAACTAALALLARWLETRSWQGTLAIGVLLALGAALRSHLLPLALAWPVAAGLLAGKCRSNHSLLAGTPVALSLLLFGFANWQIAGDFRLTPWQGAYSLWAGNSPNASGRIYAQKIRVDFGTAYDNPAKLESIALYEQATGAAPPHSIDVMNAYWRQKTFGHIIDHPLEWLGLMARKAYYFLNSYEQYDNKTYGFHQRRHMLLKWNPLHWGAVLLLAVAGVLVGLRQAKARPYIIALIVVFALYAAGSILFYTANRFRLPMLPLLAILAAGLPRLPQSWRGASAAWRTGLTAALLLTAGISYSGFFDARTTDTWEEDYALLANASLRTGRDDAAIQHARAALKMNPQRPDMLAVLAQSRFNLWALADEPVSIHSSQAAELLELTRLAAAHETNLAAVAGIYQWKLGQHQAAIATWQSIAAQDALARLCLVRTGHSEPPGENDLHHYHQHPSFPLLLALVRPAHSAHNHRAVARLIDVILRPAVPAQTHDSPADT